jgi:membrane protein
MQRRDWRAVLMRTWTETGEDNIGLVAAGTAFYVFAAIIPLLASTVLVYGLVADADTVTENIRALFKVLPADAASSIGDQLATVVQTSGGKKGLGLALAILLALYGATKGASAMISALNVAYGEHERRGIIKLTLLALTMVVAGVVMIFAAIAVTGVAAFLESLIPGAPGAVLGAIRIGGYVVLGLFVMTGAACLYRFGPSRAHARWVWLSPGAVIATLLWLAGSVGFALYVSNFGNYGATYGSLSAVIVLLTWLWLSAYVFLLGAELNSELEHQTMADTTTGPPAPMGQRGAAVADRVVTHDGSGTSPPPPRPVAAPPRKSALRPLPMFLAGYGLARIGKRRIAGAGLIGAAALLATRGRSRRDRR